jgi:hypothetical protein
MVGVVESTGNESEWNRLIGGFFDLSGTEYPCSVSIELTFRR